jgi:hypothetical protein
VQSEIGWNDLKWDALRIFAKSKQRQGSIRVKKAAAVGANRSGAEDDMVRVLPLV